MQRDVEGIWSDIGVTETKFLKRLWHYRQHGDKTNRVLWRIKVDCISNTRKKRGLWINWWCWGNLVSLYFATEMESPVQALWEIVGFAGWWCMLLMCVLASCGVFCPSNAPLYGTHYHYRITTTTNSLVCLSQLSFIFEILHMWNALVCKLYS